MPANTHRAFMIHPATARKVMIACGTEEFCAKVAASRSEQFDCETGVTTVDDTSVKHP